MRKFLHNDKKDIDSAIINTARRKNQISSFELALKVADFIHSTVPPS